MIWIKVARQSILQNRAMILIVGAGPTGFRLMLEPRSSVPLPSFTVPSKRCTVPAATVVSQGLL